jgi:hypothetical protein
MNCHTKTNSLRAVVYMKRLYVPLLLSLSVVFLGACGAQQAVTRKQPRQTGGFTPPPSVSEEVEDSGPKPRESAVQESPAPQVVEDKPVSNPAPAPSPRLGNPEYGKPVPGKPGFVTSPYAPAAGLVDVRGFPPGTEVKDPYTGKIFLVP